MIDTTINDNIISYNLLLVAVNQANNMWKNAQILIFNWVDHFLIIYSDYRFKNALRVKGKFATEWKRLSCNGVFEYAGLSEFNEPHFKRIVQGKAIYLSLWGKPGKKKWRIGPDVASKVCWCYTKKRSADFGIPASGWYQSAGDKWEPIDLKISVIT